MKTFTMQLDGNLNDVEFRIQGAGERQPGCGIVHGRYELSRTDGTDMEILGVDHWIFNSMVITGYPSETGGSNNTENPFKDRPYRYRRTVDFLSRGAVDLEVDVNFAPEGLLESRFKVNGRVRVPPLQGVESTIETWVPLSEKEILGTFTMAWVSRDETRIPCIAKTYYELVGAGPSLSTTRHRQIEIEATGTLWQFNRWQRSTMIANEMEQDELAAFRGGN